MYGYGGGYGGLGGDYGGMGGGVGPVSSSGGFSGRLFTMFGWLLTILAIASLSVAVANTTYTYINYQHYLDDGNCPESLTVIKMCLIPFVYISSGIWGSIPVFITGILSLRISIAPGLLRIFQTLVLVSAVVFTPAMMVINSIEIAAGNMPEYYSISQDGITGDVVKFVLPLVVAALAAIEFLILLLMLCYIFTNRTSAAGGQVIMGEPIADYGGDMGYGDDLGYGDEMFDYGGGDMGGGGGYMMGGGGAPGGGGAGGGGAGGGASSSAAGGASGGGGASNNNNNNNIVVPPVIFPPAPAAAAPQMIPFPIYIPQGGGSPVVVTTTSNPAGPAPAPAPQPIFLPLPAPPRRRPLPPRPVLRPLPPTRYYPNRRVGEVRRYAGAGYMAGMDSPFSGKPWDRY